MSTLHVLGCAAGQAEREQPPARGGPALLQQPRRLVVQVRGDHGHDRGHRALIQVEADAGRLPDDDAHDVRDHGPDHRCEHAHSPSPVWTSSRTVTRSICSAIRATSASTSTASSRAASAAAISRIAAPCASTSGTSRSTPSAATRLNAYPLTRAVFTEISPSARPLSFGHRFRTQSLTFTLSLSCKSSSSMSAGIPARTHAYSSLPGQLVAYTSRCPSLARLLPARRTASSYSHRMDRFAAGVASPSRPIMHTPIPDVLCPGACEPCPSHPRPS